MGLFFEVFTEFRWREVWDGVNAGTNSLCVNMDLLRIMYGIRHLPVSDRRRFEEEEEKENNSPRGAHRSSFGCYSAWPSLDVFVNILRLSRNGNGTTKLSVGSNRGCIVGTRRKPAPLPSILDPLSDPHYSRGGSLITGVAAASKPPVAGCWEHRSSARSGVWAARCPVRQDRRLSNPDRRVRHRLAEDLDDNKRLSTSRPSATGRLARSSGPHGTGTVGGVYMPTEGGRGCHLWCCR